jgi:hypothetical protein
MTKKTNGNGTNLTTTFVVAQPEISTEKVAAFSGDATLGSPRSPRTRSRQGVALLFPLA